MQQPYNNTALAQLTNSIRADNLAAVQSLAPQCDTISVTEKDMLIGIAAPFPRISEWLVSHWHLDMPVAAAHGILNTVKFHLADNDPSQPIAVSGETPLLLAAYCGHLPLVEWLCCVKHVDAHNEHSHDGSTALIIAAARGRLQVVQFLLTKVPGVTVTERTVCGDTALHRAALRGRLQVVRWLAQEAKCPLDLENNFGDTPLVAAAGGGQLEVVKLLIKEMSVSPQQRNAQTGVTPLLAASVTGNFEVLQWLLREGGSQVCETDNEGFSCFLLAVEAGYLDIVKWLVHDTHFFDPRFAKNNFGDTALFRAAFHGRTAVVRWLLTEGGSDYIIERDKAGWSALLTAAEQQHLDVVRCLLIDGWWSWFRVHMLTGQSALSRTASSQFGTDVALQCNREAVEAENDAPVQMFSNATEGSSSLGEMDKNVEEHHSAEVVPSTQTNAAAGPDIPWTEWLLTSQEITELHQVTVPASMRDALFQEGWIPAGTLHQQQDRWSAREHYRFPPNFKLLVSVAVWILVGNQQKLWAGKRKRGAEEGGLEVPTKKRKVAHGTEDDGKHHHFAKLQSSLMLPVELVACAILFWERSAFPRRLYYFTTQCSSS
eukprot:TRINITY_DN94775_c0_g1_i1.p1 TRINITY_DN94775_c0_g1~~TRINITY_DN94775_c0_g1_i1.p1  ORF type:complete len:601 (+),score=33.60 TRINITY_DN94775_c0_g1_i1:74-1876(+)